MEENNNKLFVFEKKEVVLIFVFIVMIAAISFTMGVRIGKKLSLKEDGYLKQDIEKINLKSVAEENVNTIVNEKDEPSTDPEIIKEQNDKALEQRLKEEMEKLAQDDAKMPSKIQVKETNESNIEDEQTNTNTQDATNTMPQDIYNQEKDYQGKYTIQLSSHQSEEEAKEFADGFILQGYDVIINEVVIPGKGKWFRVSIGAFDNVDSAKDYLEKEKKIFSSKDYVIRKF